MGKKMHKNTVIWYLIMGLLMTILFAGSFNGTVQAQEIRDQIIRVGCYEYEGMIEKGEDGSLSGYGVDYLERIAGYTGWKYEYVCVDKEEAYRMLESGEVDMLCGVPLDTERVRGDRYSAWPLAIVSTCLYVRPLDERYYYEDYEAFDGMKIGILKRADEKKMLDDYAEVHHFQYKMVEFEDMEALFEGLNHNRVDAVFTIGQEGYSNYRSVAQAGMFELYCLFGKDSEDKALLLEWDSTVMRLRSELPNFTTDLYKRYYSIMEMPGKPIFTREEARYIRDSGKVVIGMMKNRPGLSFYVEGEGYSGVMADMMKAIEERSGLEFEYMELRQGERAVDFIDSHDGNAIVPLMLSDVLVISNRLRLIRTGVESGLVPVGKKNHEISLNDEINVALAKSFFGFEDHIRETFSKANIVYYDDTKSCLHAVAAGEADITFGDIINLNAEWSDPHLDQLYVLSLYYSHEELVMSLSENADPRLRSVLQKTIDSLGERRRERYFLEVLWRRQTGRCPLWSSFTATRMRYWRSPVCLSCCLPGAWSFSLTGRKRRRFFRRETVSCGRLWSRWRAPTWRRLHFWQRFPMRSGRR